MPKNFKVLKVKHFCSITQGIFDLHSGHIGGQVRYVLCASYVCSDRKLNMPGACEFN